MTEESWKNGLSRICIWKSSSSRVGSFWVLEARGKSSHSRHQGGSTILGQQKRSLGLALQVHTRASVTLPRVSTPGQSWRNLVMYNVFWLHAHDLEGNSPVFLFCFFLQTISWCLAGICQNFRHQNDFETKGLLIPVFPWIFREKILTSLR